MYIHEAVSLAMAQGKFIRRTTPEGWENVKLEPTNGPKGIILHITAESDSRVFILHEKYRDGKGRPFCPRWEPWAEDLMADDWVLVD